MRYLTDDKMKYKEEISRRLAEDESSLKQIELVEFQLPYLYTYMPFRAFIMWFILTILKCVFNWSTRWYRKELERLS